MKREVLKVAFVMVAAMVVCALLLLAHPQARAQSQEEMCYVFADMAVVARSLVLEDIPKDKVAKIMERIYAGPGMGKEVVDIMVRIEAAAQRSTSNPGTFGSHVLAACKSTIGTAI